MQPRARSACGRRQLLSTRERAPLNQMRCAVIPAPTDDFELLKSVMARSVTRARPSAQADTSSRHAPALSFRPRPQAEQTPAPVCPRTLVPLAQCPRTRVCCGRTPCPSRHALSAVPMAVAAARLLSTTTRCGACPPRSCCERRFAKRGARHARPLACAAERSTGARAMVAACAGTHFPQAG